MSSETLSGPERIVATVTGKWRGFLNVYSRFPLQGKVGLWLLVGLVLMAVFAPVVAPHDPIRQDRNNYHANPSIEHPLGMDHVGRDVLSRVIFGSRISLAVATLSVVWALVVGAVFGSIGAYRGGILDDIIMRLADSVMSFPSVVLAIVLVVTIPPSIITLAFAIGFPYVARYARLIRGEVLSVKEEPFIEAAEGLGMPDRDILFREVLPNSFQPVLVQVTFHFPLAVLAEAGLSFLGLGVQPPTPTWGGMIQKGQPYMPEVWWPVIWPGIAIFITVWAFNLVGDSVQDEWDPYSERGG